MSPTRSSSSHQPRSAPGASQPVVRIGCSGWHYKSWRGRVYPETLPAAAWLRAYSRRFTTVEINNSFYRLPAEETFAGWRTQVPKGFVFAVKASRFLTHIKRLRDPEEPLERLFARVRALGGALGPVLYQMPPRWIPDPERLRGFLEALPARIAPGSRRRLQHVIEFRDPRGYQPWIVDLLGEYGAALCVHDMQGSETPQLMLGPIAYLRLHGFGARYGGSYPDELLDAWAEWIRSAVSTGRDTYVYFNNDVNGFAVSDASRLMTRIGVCAAGSRVAAYLQGRTDE